MDIPYRDLAHRLVYVNSKSGCFGLGTQAAILNFMIFGLNTDSWFWLCICILCNWRLTTLICFERGPFSIMVTFRKFLYRIRLGSLIECFHCTSIWMAAIISLLAFQPLPVVILLIFAIAGATSIIERAIQPSYNTKNYEND